MKNYLFLLMIFGFLGCFTTEYYEKCPPLTWQDNGLFTSAIELPGGHPYLSVGIRSDEKSDVLEKMKELYVNCEIVNKGINKLKISWIADNVEEKKNGERIILFDNGSEKRSLILMPGQRLVWYVGKMGDLLNTDFLTIQDYESYSKHWSVLLRLDFKNPNKLKKVANPKVLEIPVSAYSSDNI